MIARLWWRFHTHGNWKILFPSSTILSANQERFLAEERMHKDPDIQEQRNWNKEWRISRRNKDVSMKARENKSDTYHCGDVNPGHLSMVNARENWIMSHPRVLGNRKKIYRVDFFGKASFSGLTNYVIRHNSQNGNMMSLPWALCSRWPRCLTSLTNPPCWSLFKRYALKVIL